MEIPSVIFILYCLAAVRHSTSGIIRFRKIDVEKCPQKQSTWDEAASRLNCSLDENGRSTYHCVPEQDKSSLVEFCYNRLVGLFNEGYCIHLSSTGFLNSENCHGLFPGCPKEPYLSNQIFKYPDCQDINADERCFIADPTCPNKSRDFTDTSIQSTTIANSTSDIFSNGTTSTTNTENEPGDEQTFLVVIGFVVFVGILMSFIVSLLMRLRRRQIERFRRRQIERFRRRQIERLRRRQIEKIRERKKREREYKRLSGQSQKLQEDQLHVMYFLLLIGNYSFHLNDELDLSILNLIRQGQEQELITASDISNILANKVLKEFISIDHEGRVRFKSEVAQYVIFSFFVSDSCFYDNIDQIEFFIKMAPTEVVKQYCRSERYCREDTEFCINLPDDYLDMFIRKLHLEIISHRTVEDDHIHEKISQIVSIPLEVLKMDENGRKAFEEDLKVEKIEIYRSICMLVGCAGAGKTTLYRKLRKANYKNTKSTVGLEVHNDVFVVDEDTCRLIVNDKETVGWADGQKTMTLFDFAGQCAYYACHQVYLSRRAVFVLVIDMSNPLEHSVNETVCDQKDTIFNDWTYGDYFVFWLKSIHTYCNEDSPVILVATHVDQASEEVQALFYDSLLNKLPQDLNLNLHLDQTRYIKTGLHSSNISDLEKCICSVIKSQESWGDKMPRKWVQLENIIREKKERKIIHLSELKSEFEKNEDDIKIILRFYHDVGIILYFDEPDLSNIAIVDVQWFVDAFKYVISDMNHVKNKAACGKEWNDFNKTGQLKDDLLVRVWKDGKFQTAFHQRKQVLLYMQRLGLIAVGDHLHYVPCINKKNLGDREKFVIMKAKETSSILVFEFDFLPHFYFYRVVVACFSEDGWKLLEDEDASLFKCAAFFRYKHHNIAIGVTNTSIQLQIFVRAAKLDKTITLQLRETVSRIINKVTSTFHKQVLYKIGYACQPIQICDDVDKLFIKEEEILDYDFIECPRHGLTSYHDVNCRNLRMFWTADGDETSTHCCGLKRCTTFKVQRKETDCNWLPCGFSRQDHEERRKRRNRRLPGPRSAIEIEEEDEMDSMV